MSEQPHITRPKIEPPQSYLLSSLEGLEIRWDPEHKPPTWAFITNTRGEQVYFYALQDLWLTSEEAHARAESLI